MKVGLFCGGPSLERGISLNSARLVLDHLADKNIEIVPVYFDAHKKGYRISTAQLYSNTPSDFDFKLRQTAVPLAPAALVKLLKSVDIVFPVIHGAFGEDGELQAFLEAHSIPFVGSSAASCRQAFDKYRANEFIRANGFYAPPSMVLEERNKGSAKAVREFFKKNKLARAIVKPAIGGSSIGVFSVGTPAGALAKAKFILTTGIGKRVVIEPFAKGTEFTVIVLQNRFGLPVAILPTEIETDYAEHQIFDFRKKYLPTRHVTYHCPPRFTNEVIERIQTQAEQIFALFGTRDFARFDGWVLENGEIWFSDFNPISGMEQNSFLFQQASRVGLSHRDVLRLVLQRACERYGLRLPPREEREFLGARKPVHVLCGGQTSERQVSLMSGTNVWLKLKRSERYAPTLFLWDLKGNVWELPYAYALNHTVEEILENCVHARESQARLDHLERKVALRLALALGESTEPRSLPIKMSLDAFIKSSRFVFIALHGGDGESGVLQKKLARHKVAFNGSGEKVSALCMDKWATGRSVARLNIEGLTAVPGKIMPFAAALRQPAVALWKELCVELGTRTLIVKPRADGCSSGVVHLYNDRDLKKYLAFARRRAVSIPGGTFTNQSGIVEMPSEKIRDLLFERFIETDIVGTAGGKLTHQKRSGWVEVTVGVVGEGKKMRVMNPSLTVAEGEVLSVEEKFQGGTGINITPPPAVIVRPKALAEAKKLIRQLTKGIGIVGYARIDAFLEVATGNVQVIEVNNLPALTPSTVFYQQGLAEQPPLYPRELLEKLIANKGY